MKLCYHLYYLLLYHVKQVFDIAFLKAVDLCTMTLVYCGSDISTNSTVHYPV